MSVMDAPAAGPVAQFGALVLADTRLALRLSQIEDEDRFCQDAVGAATAQGIALDAAALRGAARSDVLGLARWQITPQLVPHWPPEPWLPIQVSAVNGEPCVDWACFGASPLRQPFYEESIRQAMWRPFNKMFRYRTLLRDFLAGAAREPGLAPDGFIFHMSRCGSTLVSQMLAALPENIVVSEAAPIDAMVQLSRTWPALLPDQHARHLAAMVSAFGRKRSGRERRLFFKLDSWHVLALPLFRRAFPDVPWIFLYRDPVEVLVSQSRQLGSQMVPGILPPGFYGLDDPGGIPGDDYTAQVLGKVCDAAAAFYDLGGGLTVNYRDLPGAFWSRILPHFGMAVGPEQRDMMQRATRYDVKAQHNEFTDDRDGKQREASDGLRACAETHIGAAYRRLEELSARSARLRG